MIIRKDGIRIQLQPRDLDGDGRVGTVEIIPRSTGESNDVVIPQQISESREAMEALNEDVEDHQGFSTVDFKTRLHGQMIPQVAALEGGYIMRFSPQRSRNVIKLIKRLIVSKNGLGRRESIEVNQTLKENSGKKTMLDRFKGFFGGE